MNRKFAMEQTNRLHIYQIESPNGLSRRDYLYSLIMEGARARYTTLSPKERNRIAYEWSHISKSEDNIDYLLLVQDIIKRIKAYGGMVGPGRGSTPGSIINYCLGITMVDPLKFGLLFERFYEFRTDTIDIDTDIDTTTKEHLYDLLSVWYGSEHVQRIPNSDKTAIHPSKYLITQEDLSSNASLPHIEIEGKNVLDINPLDIGDSQCAVDFIELENLNELREEHLDWSMVELNNDLALKNICHADLWFNSSAMRNAVARLNHIDIKTLATLFAIDRPGQYVLEEYIENHNARYEGDECGAVNDIVAETNGLFIFQEQLIQMLEEVADFTPDLARQVQKLMSRKDVRTKEYKAQFIVAGVKKGYEQHYLEMLWNEMYDHTAMLMFSKAHAVAYTILAYWISLVRTHR